jgi:serine O-acetyltransferase
MLPAEKRINSKKQLDEWLNYEIGKYKTSALEPILELFNVTETAIRIKHSKLLRKTEYYVNTKKKFRGILYRFRLERFQNRYCLHIPLNCFEKGLRLVHVGPVLVNPNCAVGEDCSLHINTALAAGGVSDAAPTLGKGCVVGVGAVVLGGVRIADYVAVGANAVVTKSIEEENIAVAGVPAKKVSSNGAKEWNKVKKGEQS